MTPQTILLDSEDKRQRALMIIGTLRLDRPLEVLVRPYIEKRSQSQNARLWVLHQKVAEHLGVSPDDMHEEALCRFFGYEEKKIGPFVRRVPIERSRVQDKKRFREFMDATEHWYIEEFGIWLE